jgi:regulator of sigma E protease
LLYLIEGYCVVGLMVAVGLGFVIFVHELGHFVVAKLCGVKCEKFYLGFDIAGLKLCKFRYGETEYGIGILPLGGYVKMLGQEDNPARMREEMERAKQKGREERGEGRERAQSDSGAIVQDAASSHQQSTIIDHQSETPSPLSPLPSPLYDPRSFLTQSVPKRMAIISAGVIMNVIFAFLMAVAAFSMGVERIACVVGAVFPGEPAWQADLRVDDEVLRIAGKKMEQFRDLQTAISLGDIDPEAGVPIEVRRAGVKEPLQIIVKPDRSRGAFFIGVGCPYTARLKEDRKTWLIQKCDAVLPGSVADLATPPFRNGDQIVKIDGTPIETYADIIAQLARKPDRKIDVTVLRTEPKSSDPSAVLMRRLTIPVAPNHVRSVGLVMPMGPILAIQANSPAAAAGLAPGDVLEKVDGRADLDPMTLPDQLRRLAGKTVELTIRRKGAKSSEVVRARLREPTSFFSSEAIPLDQPVEAEALGIAYYALNRVDRVVAGSPAAKAGLAPNDLIVEATLVPPDKETLGRLETDQKEMSMSFGEKDRNWPALVCALQKALPGTTVRLKVSRKESEKTVTIQPVEAADWFTPDRGFVFEPLTFARQATSLGDALALGGRETLDQMTIVFRSVKKLSTNQVSPRGLAGPWTIVQMALHSADQGFAKLLLFLTLLSANLAVINFLPIPLLDGGLMMFLIYEGIRGKPANERVQVVLTYIGLIFIIALMVWVFGLDFGWISRHGK